MAFDFPSSPTTGQTYSISGGPTYVYNGTAWVVLTPGNQFNRTVFTATAGQTSFAMSYVVGAVDVYRNGVKLAPADFTATDGATIVLLNAATVGDTIEVISYPMITYSDAVKRTGDVMSGTLDVPTSAAVGAGVRIRQPSGDATPAILQFTNGTASGQLSTISASGANKLSFNDGGGGAMARIESGRLLLPYQPSFYAVKTSIPTGGAVITSWETLHVNVGSHFNASNGRFTAPVAGVYQFSFYRLGYNGSGHTDDYLRINGSQVVGYWLRTYYPSGEGSPCQMVNYVTLSAGDYVDFYVPSGLQIYSDQNGWIRFGGHLIG